MEIHCPRCAQTEIDIHSKAGGVEGTYRCKGCGRVFVQRDALISLGDIEGAVKVVDHPIRQAIVLQLMAKGEMSPTQVADAIGEGLGTVSYHMKVLRDTKPPALTRTRTRPVRGAVESFYEVAFAN